MSERERESRACYSGLRSARGDTDFFFGVVAGLLRQKIVGDTEGEVHLHGLMVDFVLDGGLALREGGADLLHLRVAGRGGQLRLELGLERAADKKQSLVWYRVVCLCVGQGRGVCVCAWDSPLGLADQLRARIRPRSVLRRLDRDTRAREVADWKENTQKQGLDKHESSVVVMH